MLQKRSPGPRAVGEPGGDNEKKNRTAEPSRAPWISRESKWEKFGLTRSGNGAPHSNLANVVRILTGHPELAGKIYLDEFLQKVISTVDGIPREWSDSDTLHLTCRLQDELELARLSDEIVNKAVTVVAQSQIRNEVIEYLEALRWDGLARMALLFVEGFGTPDSDYAVSVAKNFLISLVARAYEPGCKVDNMVVLEGTQGTFKSSVLSVIGGRWFGEIHEAIGTKDFYLALAGKWLCEISELSAFHKAENEKLKSALSCQVDRYRSPYGKRTTDHPRRCVFVGTTNEESYLRDETGARRFWPIRCTTISKEWLQQNRDQLFAEAVNAFKKAVPWWEMPAEAVSEQESRRQVDPWEDRISTWLNEITTSGVRNEVKASDVLTECLRIELSRQDRAALMRVGAVLRRLGWTRCQLGSERVKGWRRPL